MPYKGFNEMLAGIKEAVLFQLRPFENTDQAANMAARQVDWNLHEALLDYIETRSQTPQEPL